jgi:putative ABC transport system ATP-binding protein
MINIEHQSIPNPLHEHQNSPPEAPLIEMEQIAKVFKTIAGDFIALKGINARFFRGEFISVVGKSGSGKSTLVNMLTGIDHPTSGIVYVDGVEIHHLRESEMAAWRGHNLGVVFQFFQLLPTLTILENVLLPMDFCGKYPPEEREERAIDLLKLVSLDELADKIPAELSGGQQQSAAIARALANDPPIIIADEPTGNLDSRTAAIVFDYFIGLVQRGKTIIMVTHDHTLAQRTTRTLFLKDGEITDEIARIQTQKLDKGRARA